MTANTTEETAPRNGLGRRLGRSLARVRALATGSKPHSEPPRASRVRDTATDGSFAAATTDALAAAGAWVYETDAARILQRLSPAATPAIAALVGRDIRSLFDPLSPLGEHARIERAFAARERFTDLLMPLDSGNGRKLLRVSGAPFHDSRGVFLGYRGLAIDAQTTGYRPDATVSLIAPDLRHALVNVLGVIVGFGHLLQDELPAGPAQHYVARVLLAAATARNIVAVSTSAAAPASAPRAEPVRVVEVPAEARRRVLLVNEIPEIADLLSIAFDRAGFESAVCRDAAEVIEILVEDAALWDVLVTDAANARTLDVGLLHRVKTLKPDLLCVVCDEPEQAALVEADADLCWPRPTDPLALVRMVDVQLAG
jgi:hypothetical protein